MVVLLFCNLCDRCNFQMNKVIFSSLPYVLGKYGKYELLKLIKEFPHQTQHPLINKGVQLLPAETSQLSYMICHLIFPHYVTASVLHKLVPLILSVGDEVAGAQFTV